MCVQASERERERGRANERASERASERERESARARASERERECVSVHSCMQACLHMHLPTHPHACNYRGTVYTHQTYTRTWIHPHTHTHTLSLTHTDHTGRRSSTCNPFQEGMERSRRSHLDSPNALALLPPVTLLLAGDCAALAPFPAGRSEAPAKAFGLCPALALPPRTFSHGACSVLAPKPAWTEVEWAFFCLSTPGTTGEPPPAGRSRLVPLSSSLRGTLSTSTPPPLPLSSQPPFIMLPATAALAPALVAPVLLSPPPPPPRA